MDSLLNFCGQHWKPQNDGELTLFLPKQTRDGSSIYFHADLKFVPPWLEEEDLTSEYRILYVSLQGRFPALDDWRDLAGFTMESREETTVFGETVAPAMSGPEIEIWSAGMRGAGGIHSHASAGWDTKLTFGEFQGDGFALPCELEAFYPSARARQAQLDLWMQSFFGEGSPEDWEAEEQLQEGWRFHYSGRVRFDTVSCTVPINTSNPIGWAQSLARRELRMTEFGPPRVNGGHITDGTFKPEDGIGAQGRLVILPTFSEFFRRRQAQIDEEKRRDDPSPGC
jgi:hypothetical protein